MATKAEGEDCADRAKRVLDRMNQARMSRAPCEKARLRSRPDHRAGWADAPMQGAAHPADGYGNLTQFPLPAPVLLYSKNRLAEYAHLDEQYGRPAVEGPHGSASWICAPSDESRITTCPLGELPLI